MADQKLTELAAVSAPIQTTDLIYLVRSGVSNKATVDDFPVTAAVTTALALKQAADQDLTDIAALTPTNDDVMQRKAGAWTNRTVAQLKTDLSLSSVTNDAQTKASIVPNTAPGSGEILIGTGSAYAKQAVSGAITISSGGVVTAKVELGFACSDETTAITAGTGKLTFRMPFAMTVTGVRATLNTAPTGSTFIMDINESGTTILSTKLSVDTTEKTSTTAATPAVISDASLADDAEITIDFDQVGASVAGAGVKLWLIGTRT